MPNYDAIRTGLAASLSAITGVPSYAKVQNEVDAPATIVGHFRRSVPERRLGQNGQRYAVWEITVRVLAGSPKETASQDFLDRLADWNDPAGIVQVLEADQTLGGAAREVRVQQIGPYAETEVGNAKFLAFDVTLEVLA